MSTAAAFGLQPAPEKRHLSNTVGILLILAGLFCILLPLVAGVAITAIIGWLLLLAGAAHFLFAWHSRRSGAVAWQVLIGVVYLFVGLYMILHPGRGLLTLTFLLAAWFVIEGIAELILYFRLRQQHRPALFLWNGIVTLILGILIWARWPVSSVWAIGTIVGISLLFSGIARLTFRTGRPILGPA